MPTIVLILLFGAAVFVGLVALITGLQRHAARRFERQFPFPVGPSLHDSALAWAKGNEDARKSAVQPTAPTKDAYRP